MNPIQPQYSIHSGLTLCPRCKLLRPISQFMDANTRSYSAICTECTQLFMNPGVLQKQQSLSHMNVIKSDIKKEQVKKNKKIELLIPQSPWRVVNNKKLREPYTAKLVYHRLYSVVSTRS